MGSQRFGRYAGNGSCRQRLVCPHRADSLRASKTAKSKKKSSFGVSAIDTKNGKTLWRFKGADKGLTNFVFADANKIMFADKDDLITIDAKHRQKD